MSNYLFPTLRLAMVSWSWRMYQFRSPFMYLTITLSGLISVLYLFTVVYTLILFTRRTHM